MSRFIYPTPIRRLAEVLAGLDKEYKACSNPNTRASINATYQHTKDDAIKQVLSTYPIVKGNAEYITYNQYRDATEHYIIHDIAFTYLTRHSRTYPRVIILLNQLYTESNPPDHRQDTIVINNRRINTHSINISLPLFLQRYKRP